MRSCLNRRKESENLTLLVRITHAVRPNTKKPGNTPGLVVEIEAALLSILTIRVGNSIPLLEPDSQLDDLVPLHR